MKQETYDFHPYHPLRMNFLLIKTRTFVYKQHGVKLMPKYYSIIGKMHSQAIFLHVGHPNSTL